VDEPLFFATRGHVLVCTGPRCSHAGSRRVVQEATAELERRRVAYYKDGGTVRLSEASCLGACAHGPTVVAYFGAPGGGLAEAWYVGMDARRVVRLAEAVHRGDALPEDKRFGPR
jgi:(2Fe-2S) ferredoxin